MKSFVGNIKKEIDCDQLIEICKQSRGHTMYGPSKIETDQPMYDEYKLQYDLMDKAGYLRNNTIKFTHYYPGKHFTEEFSEKVAKICRVKHLGSFVSSIDPGFCAPWHTDVFNNYYKEMAEKYQMKRFVMFLSEPKPAQGFVIEDECFYMEEQGNIYEFPHIKAWHAGFNAGLETKFIFTLTGAVVL